MNNTSTKENLVKNVSSYIVGNDSRSGSYCNQKETLPKHRHIESYTHCAKNEVLHEGFLQKMRPIYLVTFTEKILTGKLSFSCSDFETEI